MKKAISCIISVCICLSFIGCAKSSSTASDGTFDEAKAISMVVKDYPDFPLNQSGVITKKLPTGGPPGTTAEVKFTTKVEKSSSATYMITLTKDWGISVNGKYALSYWKFKVTQDSVKLLESVDNDYLSETMK